MITRIAGVLLFLVVSIAAPAQSIQELLQHTKDSLWQAKAEGANLSKALIAASQIGDIELVKTSVEDGALTEDQEIGAESIRAAIDFYRSVNRNDESYAQIVEYLLSAGVKLEMENSFSAGYLFRQACELNWPFLASHVVDQYGPNGLVATSKHSPDDMIEMAQRIDITIWLLVRDSDVTGTHFLHYAVKNNLIEIAQLLIDRGSNINFQEQKHSGQTPLMEACNTGVIQMVKLLVEHGADLSIKDDFGRNAVDHAKKVGQSQIVKYLKSLK